MLIVVNRILMFNTNVSSNIIRKIGTFFLKHKRNEFTLSKLTNKNDTASLNSMIYKNKICNMSNSSRVGIQENISALQTKKRHIRKKTIITDAETIEPGFWKVKAFATAEEYLLDGLRDGLIKQDLYTSTVINTSDKCEPHVIHAVAKYEIDYEPREIYFFKEGTVVMWNIPDLEIGNVLQFLNQYEDNRYSNHLVQAESEVIAYSYEEQGKKSHLRAGNILLTPQNNSLDKYTFSNAVSQSVKLGIWEASLNHYVDSIEFITEDMKAGRKIQMSRQDVLRKQGELFALRHLINLSSDLLDTPDFYWDRDDLENLYQQICSYFSISKRTRVMNEKLNHCVELVELLSTHLSDRHHVRLEWMIIVLIMVEVGFEILHYLDRYFEREEISKNSTLSETCEMVPNIV